MRKRAAQVDETRLRITEAAVALHTTLGPAATTISAVAEEAGVTRVTVYRHFGDDEQLFAACSAHWMAQHPAPNPELWLDHPPVEPRVRVALTQLYAWYRANGDALFLFHRDFDAMPEATRDGMKAQDTLMADVLLEGSGLRGRARRRTRAAAGHVTAFPTWHSLAVEQGLTDDAAVDLASLLVIHAADVPGRRRRG